MTGVLANPTFRKLFAAQVIALVGTGLLTVALGLLAYDIAGDQAGRVLGIAMTVKMLAYVFLSPVIAAVAAHLPRKPLLIGADLVRLAVALCLPFAADAWHVYVLIFILQTASATFTPAFQALIPSVLPDETEYTSALSLSRLAYSLEAVVSPMLAAALLAVMSYHNLFLGTAVGFAASAALVFAAVLPALPALHTATCDADSNSSTTNAIEDTFRARLTSGISLMFRSADLRGLQGINLAVATAQAMVIVNTVVVVRTSLERSQSDVAILLGAFGAGSMLVALAMPRLSRRIADTTLMLTGAAAAMVLLAVVSLALATLSDAHPATSWSTHLALWLLLGASASLMLTPSSKLIARASTEAKRPALFAAQFSLSHACFLIAYPLAGLAGASLGLSAVSGILAAVGTLGVAVAAWNWLRPKRGSAVNHATDPEVGPATDPATDPARSQPRPAEQSSARAQ